MAKTGFFFTVNGGECPRIEKFHPFTRQGSHIFSENHRLPNVSSEIAVILRAGVKSPLSIPGEVVRVFGAFG